MSFFLNMNVNDFNSETGGMSMEDIKEETLYLNIKKSTTSGSTPATFLKQCVYVSILNT